MVASSSLQSGTLAPSITAPSGPPCSSTSRLVLVPFLPRSVGLGPTFFPPEAGLAHAAVGTLPVPVNLAQLGALRGQGGPDLRHHAAAAPALEPAVDGAVVAELLGQVVPLAAGAEAVDDAVEDPPPVLGRLAALGAGLPIGAEDRFDTPPEVVGDFPDGVQWLGVAALPWHGGSPSVWVLAISPNASSSGKTVLR